MEHETPPGGDRERGEIIASNRRAVQPEKKGPGLANTEGPGLGRRLSVGGDAKTRSPFAKTWPFFLAGGGDFRRTRLEDPVDGGVEDVEVERLDEEAADGEPAHVVEPDLVGMAGDEHGLALVAVLAQLLDELDAAVIGQLEVGDDQVRPGAPDLVQGLARVLVGRNPVLLPEDQGEGLADRFVVVDQGDLLGIHVRSLSLPPPL
ncbi:MAG: hypothetical protein MZV64_43750 [Ignavibacteriales bacterium]|nr:hypothetical protein [Ignavibacteriales bacterium]